MARTKKNLRGGQPAGTKRRAETSIAPDPKKTKLECPSDIMKYHLRADMAHDHGSDKFNDPKMAALYGGNDTKTTKEDSVVEFIKNNFDADAEDGEVG